MHYSLTALLFASLALAAAVAALARIDHTLRGLRIPLTSDF